MASIIVDGAFEGGAVEDVRYREGSVIEFRAPLRGSPRSMWYNFRISNAAGQALLLRQVRLDQTLSPRGYHVVRPVIRDGPDGEWRRVAPEDIVGVEEGTHAFWVSPTTDEFYVAFSYPYTTRDWYSFVASLGEDPAVTSKVLGISAEGNALPAIVVGDTQDARTDRRKQLLVLTARQHAGETPGSYVLEGVIEAALSDVDIASWCRDHLVIAAFPFVDVDGVVAGRYGKDRPPRDFNRDWSTQPRHRELGLIQVEIARLAAQHEYVVFTDLHAPGVADFSYVVPASPYHVQSRWMDLWQMASHFESVAPDGCPCRVFDYSYHSLNWAGETYEQTASAAQAVRYGVISATLETTYHRHAGGGYVGPDDWRAFGRMWLATIVCFLQAAESGVPCEVPVPQHLAEPPYTFAQWHIVNLPAGAELAESGDGSLTVTPTETRNSSWVTHNEFLALGSEGVSCTLEFEYRGQKAATVNVYALYYAGEWSSGRCYESAIRVEPGRRAVELHVPPGMGASTARLSLRSTSLTGELRVSVAALRATPGG